MQNANSNVLWDQIVKSSPERSKVTAPLETEPQPLINIEEPVSNESGSADYNLPTVQQQTSPVALIVTPPVVVPQRFPHNLPRELNLIRGQDGKAYSIQRTSGNPCVLPVGSSVLNNKIRELALREGINLRKNNIPDINSMLHAHTESSGITQSVWSRVAPISNGIEIDLGDDKHSRIRITAGKSETITEGSSVLFYRSLMSLPMAIPAEVGDLNLLRKYLNLHPRDQVLLMGWISYTLAHPKMPTSKYPILVLNGGQGSGKSSACDVISKLIDPNRVGLQILPNNGKDLAIAAQNSHILCYDNIRGFSQTMADILCVAATGGSLSSRQLYSDADQSVLTIHAAIVLNGIHSFIDQPDLAQRCLPLHLKPIPEVNRKSEGAIHRDFETDLPYIFRGLLDLIAEIFKHLPTVETTHPERMIDFVLWLAAMEKAQNVPAGIYQREYSEALRHGQLDSLQENVLAAAILELAEEYRSDNCSWTPDELLRKLNANASKGTQRSKDWPPNAISLSKRLLPLQAGLLSQGISLEFSRGKQRKITITVK